MSCLLRMKVNPLIFMGRLQHAASYRVGAKSFDPAFDRKLRRSCQPHQTQVHGSELPAAHESPLRCFTRTWFRPSAHGGAGAAQ